MDADDNIAAIVLISAVVLIAAGAITAALVRA
jgi:hypothetical protein